MFSPRANHLRPDRTVTTRSQQLRRWGFGFLYWVAVANWQAIAAAVEPVPIMALDPELPRPVVEKQFPPGLVELWIRTLEQPNRELRRLSVSSIARGRQHGVPGLEAAIEPLMDVLAQLPPEERLTRLMIVRALVDWDAQQAAALLREQLRADDREMAEMVEPALTRWGPAAMRDVWLQRLQSDVESPRMHILALRGLTSLAEPAALPRLLALASDAHTPADVRLEAASALGQLQDSGLLEAAVQLSSDESPRALVSRLVAARMLARHRGPETERLLARLAVDPQTVVRRVSLARLFEIDPTLILPILDVTLAADDVHVRRWGAKAAIANPDAERVATLGRLLRDPDPELRRFVCDALVTLAQQPSLHEAVLTQGRRMLAGDAWRGQEQAILLLATLDDKSIADSLLSELAAMRPEVYETAAWGLSRLQVPATLEPMLRFFTETTERRLSRGETRARMDEQLSHLAQAFGRMKYRPADEVLRKYIPKTAPFSPVPRAAAIWALGWIHSEQGDEQLANQFLGRLLDLYGEIPEDELVSRMSAISLGRMKAEHTLGSLRDMHQSETLRTAVGYAAAWSIQQLTGEPIGEIPPLVDMQHDWLLSPLEQP